MTTAVLTLAVETGGILTTPLLTYLSEIPMGCYVCFRHTYWNQCFLVHGFVYLAIKRGVGEWVSGWGLL